MHDNTKQVLHCANAGRDNAEPYQLNTPALIQSGIWHQVYPIQIPEGTRNQDKTIKHNTLQLTTGHIRTGQDKSYSRLSQCGCHRFDWGRENASCEVMYMTLHNKISQYITAHHNTQHNKTAHDRTKQHITVQHITKHASNRADDRTKLLSTRQKRTELYKTLPVGSCEGVKTLLHMSKEDCS